MTTTLAELEEKVRALSPGGKVVLRPMLVSELDGRTHLAVEKAWIAEPKRWHRELIEGHAKGIPGEQVFSHVSAYLAQ